jgi:hypothetical protein
VLSPAIVYCLQLQFFWNGEPLTAGRLPFYGTEVANISYERGHAPAETVVYRLDPEPVVYLAGKEVEVLFSEPLPAEPGKLEVRARLLPCADRILADDARLRTPSTQRDWDVKLSADPGPAGPRTGRLAVGKPHTAVMELARAAGDERFKLELAGRRGGKPTVEVWWHRYATPGRPRIVFVRAHRPFDPPVVRLRPKDRDSDSGETW